MRVHELNCAPFHRANADDSYVILAPRGLQRKGEHSVLWVDCRSQQRDSVFVFHHWYQHQLCPQSLSFLPVHIDTRELDQLFVNVTIETTKPFSLSLLLSVNSHCISQKLVSLTFVLSETVLISVLRTKYTDFEGYMVWECVLWFKGITRLLEILLSVICFIQNDSVLIFLASVRRLLPSS